MGPLHTVNKSPAAGNALASCLAHLTAGAAILLMEDGVYAALAAAATAPLVAAAAEGHPVYVLEPDLVARGLGESRLLHNITRVDYGGFVDLAAAHSNIVAWF